MGIAILYRIVRAGLPEVVTAEQSLEGGVSWGQGDSALAEGRAMQRPPGRSLQAEA